MAEIISRRRAISIMAATAGLPLLGLTATAQASASPVIWRGQALGAPATLVLNHPDPAEAERLISRVVSEVERLEEIFSLYRASSALCELNRVGALAAPPAELVELLKACGTAWRASGGAFDPTIQPLWQLYASHFSSPGADPAGPAATDIEAARSRIGFDAVSVNRDRIAFARPGMALSLNGIAQGYVTDVVVGLLKAEGITSSLVSMGESRALGAKEDGSPWRVGLAETEAGANPDTVVDLVDKAVATSAGAGFHFDGSGRFSHILDPKHKTAALNYRRISVIAPSATIADAFSTAFSLLDEAAIRTVLAENTDMVVDLIDKHGVHSRF